MDDFTKKMIGTAFFDHNIMSEVRNGTIHLISAGYTPLLEGHPLVVTKVTPIMFFDKIIAEKHKQTEETRKAWCIPRGYA